MQQRSWRLWLTVACAAFAALGLATAPAGSDRTSLSVPAPPRGQVGQDLYASQCEPCHGQSGKGDGPAARFLDSRPRDLTSGEWQYLPEPTQEAIADLIARGIEGTEMEPFEELLEPEEILAVAAYVLATFAPREETSR